MKRRQLIRYAGASLLAATGTAWASGFERYEAQTPKGDSLLIQGLGHSCFLLTSKRWRILVNPFRAIGCTAGYRLPKVEADLVLISSQLWDEGAAENLPGNPKVLFEPGVYNINGLRIQGISIAHDRQGGRRFGTNVAWRWNQAGIRILHLGGAAAPIEIEQRILMGSPDVALIPVGGGAKVYTPEEAKQVIEALNPKIVIPTQYQTAAADKSACDLLPLSDFLKVVEGMNISQLKGDSLRLVPANLPKEGTLIRVFNAQAALKS
jgi:L-ascorbate metabolism protein UlaG (beta-lactamase superfamily)